MTQPTVYLAGPLGFSEVGRLFMNQVLLPLLQGLGFKVHNPWTLTPEELINPILVLPYGKEKKNAWKKLNCIIGRNNVDAIEDSDLIVAILDGTDVDSGTAAEIGYGAAKHKKVFGYRGDFRLSADNDGSTVNLQVEYFITQSGGNLVSEI